MTENVVSLTKQPGRITPYEVLQELAKIDATLIFRFEDHWARMKYEAPDEHRPRLNYLTEVINGAPDEFRFTYFNEIWDLLVLPRSDCTELNVSEIRVPLHQI